MTHVTAVIPAYDTAKYLTRCLNSILKQQHKDWDAIIVDDGSTDATANIALEFIKKDSRFSLLSYPKHHNVTYATALGIQSARGPIITIIDSDDEIFPHSFSKVVPVFDDVGVGFAWTHFVRDSGRMGWSQALPRGVTLWQAMTEHKWWRASHQRFFRKSTYEQTPKLNTTFTRSSDYQLVLLLASTGCRTVFVPEVTYRYYQHRVGSLTSQGSDKQKRTAKQIKKWVCSVVKR